MRVVTKILLIVAAALVVVGALSFVVVMSLNRWDFSRISTEKFKTEQYDITDAFHSIAVETTTADISVRPAEDGVARVVCFENEKTPHEVAVIDGVLTVKRVDHRKHWTDYITIFGFSSPKITVYLPENAYAALTLKSSTGDSEIARGLQFDSITAQASTGDITCYASATGAIRLSLTTGDITLQGTSAGSLSLSVTTGEIEASSLTVLGALELQVSTGDAELTNVTCLSFTSTGDTGDLELDAVVVEGLLSAKRSTGDISFFACDAAELLIETDTGSVKGSLLTAKHFLAHSDTGRVSVPETATGGRCKVTTDTGNIHITLVSG
jgi:DUF4097 and DUF4098 domain-containing protein YvlB